MNYETCSAVSVNPAEDMPRPNLTDKSYQLLELSVKLNDVLDAVLRKLDGTEVKAPDGKDIKCLMEQMEAVEMWLQVACAKADKLAREI